MSKLDKTEVLSAFEAAYEAVNGKKPEITIKPGWYSIDGGKNMRLADVAALTEELTSGTAGASEEKPVKKPAAKKAAPAPAAKTKAAAFTVVTANEEGYKAEEAWIVELAEKDHDCRLPRGVV
ncbi:hypothetical protein L1077_20935 [Pseudoalteromonas luteoviolacea]|uniref:Uncharacterized protein n=1 Tax=Pseudoalteromonas luteoviolacea H33 TaxID=1365251 RepID=A0A167E2J7_9GAMM|nr:hypothetical protein [Pseudoalteromonas luteoviolacea]KZN49942.1 hypothetical protein N476_17760 [Pseudoalteromonas luteoviolacea H33]KZN79040.1 hypothetical protein N477_06960 [Pseudoalteromonas luteoviolacea H33-S]MBQ4879916.1 hypothetical protein [Pseudoalteromonas luteoviolacea]MBQ4908926.1 hypothetical protein [Pseudoalteromonas luteoviolacea]MCF6441903.1 hypothetical protein [Pseudoalteromonas luteoviolacea]